MAEKKESVWIHKDHLKTDEGVAGIKQVAEWLGEKCDQLQKKLDRQTGKISPIENANKMGGLKCSISSYSYNSSRWGTDYSWQETAVIAVQHADKLLEESRVIHEANAPLIDSNLEAERLLSAFMENLGIPARYTTSSYTSPRTGRQTRNRNTHNHTAGWLSDMVRCIKVNDGFGAAEISYNDFIKKVDKYKRDNQAADDEKERELKQTENYKEKSRALASYVVKYGIDASSTWGDLLKSLGAKPTVIDPADYYTVMRNSCTADDDYLLVKSELEFLNLEAVRNIKEVCEPFAEVSDKPVDTWRHGTEHEITIKSELTGKTYSTGYRTQPEHGLDECNDWVKWHEVIKNQEQDG